MSAFTAQDLRSIEAQTSPASRRGSPNEHAQLNALAETLARHPARRAFSPIVIAGLTRIVEAILIATSGVLVHSFYVAPVWGYEPGYYVAVFGMTILALLVFEALDINHVGAFRAPLYQGFRLAGGWTFVFLVALAAIFFLKLQDIFSRVWLLSWYLGGLAILLLVRGIVSGIVFFSLAAPAQPPALGAGLELRKLPKAKAVRVVKEVKAKAPKAPKVAKEPKAEKVASGKKVSSADKKAKKAENVEAAKKADRKSASKT